MENTTFAVGNVIKPRKALGKSFHYLNILNINSAEIIELLGDVAGTQFASVKILKCKHPILCDGRKYVIVGVGKPSFQAMEGSVVVVNLSLFDEGYFTDTDSYSNSSLLKYIKIIMLKRTL